MRRRDFVKGFAVATATASTALGQQSSPQAQNPPPATTAPSAAASGSRARNRAEQMARFHTPNIPLSQPDDVAITKARYFTPVRYATLVQLCEIFMPAGEDNPSASKAGTPEFLDFYIGASPAEQQALYNNGLDRLEADCRKQFNVSFAKADEKQVDAVIRPHLKGWMNDHPPREGQERFIGLAHRDIREATINSPAWAVAAEASGERTPGVGLYWHPIEPGIQTWVNHGAAQSKSTTKHKA
ncbi:gluconate 2-dehydrogenase subunit 3 family protein [Edaphobacter albus]|uniref:gluconate 2-dehydrogenase subunit 3 family protein n=1 Tax=Edaphobacter sp. 4G125 TaxID=2763071 RepID=UPI001644BCD3|nr:gluconate 2-dehydrogenase subunit 3 family protein [Edaphobacter sp. 4G125]QNI37346.1 gluconate 2-dehydrogenase subunit 3 family protein [Edaphobacter sp. 4G125]